ncbi:MAG TPA: hypothetical protein DIW81_25170, partial [Planctomycetaceae bacterium]|nr:hypothetical protein [Planctomycetaceae bacterium]
MRFHHGIELFCCGLLAVSLIGCSKPEEYREVTDSDMVEDHDHDHDHAHTAPHGGILVELGEHAYSAEIVIAETDPKVTVYILDAHAESAVAAKADSISLVDDEGPISLKA